MNKPIDTDQLFKDPSHIKTAWVIWNLLSRLNDLLWDYYEQEFLTILSKDDRTYQEQMQDWPF
jgi:hypothetical protein